jgi:trimeric autotransporter adhesin
MSVHAPGQETLFSLKPVTFRYTKEIGSIGTSQFGLVAEDVEKVNPDLVVCDKEGKAYSVRYDQVNAMLLNEFLEEHSRVEELRSAMAQQRKDFETAISWQQKQTERLVARLNEQEARIQKVSAQIEMVKSDAQMLVENR